jgi:LuxR family maltose regulon positive regulatory protein
MHDYGTSFIAFATGARAALLSGSLEETHTLLAEGMRARQFCTTAMPYMAVRGRIHLAKVFLSLADLVSARHLLREITDILHKRPKLGTLVEETEQLRAVIASSTVNIPGRTPLTPAELRVLPLLQTHLTFPQIAERLFVSVNTIRTQVGSIYRKLAVTTRAEAVDQATRVGLLGG